MLLNTDYKVHFADDTVTQLSIVFLFLQYFYQHQHPVRLCFIICYVFCVILCLNIMVILGLKCRCFSFRQSETLALFLHKLTAVNHVVTFSHPPVFVQTAHCIQVTKYFYPNLTQTRVENNLHLKIAYFNVLLPQ